MASQQQTYTTDMTVTAAMLNAEFGELYSNLTNSNISASAAIAFSKLASDAWTTNTPTWGADTVNPAIGNGTNVGRYVKIGRIVVFEFTIIMGSTTTYGSGNYTYSLPYTAATVTSLVNVGSLLLIDNSPTTYRVGLCLISSAGTTMRWTIDSLGGIMDLNNPISLTTNDSIYGQVVYEASS